MDLISLQLVALAPAARCVVVDNCGGVLIVAVVGNCWSYCPAGSHTGRQINLRDMLWEGVTMGHDQDIGTEGEVIELKIYIDFMKLQIITYLFP